MAGRPGKVVAAVHLSPDEVERRTFAIEDRGYDRDEVRVFLLEVAAALRLALHTTRPPMPAAGPADTAVARPTTAPPGPTSSDDFARLGSEVAEVLRSAHDAVAALHEQADTEIAARQAEAAAQADEVRRQAEVDAAWTHDRAKRVLITAQDQADAIVAEAETAAADLIATARRQAREHADQVATRTRRHAEQILRAEREALRRLHQAQAGVAAAVEMLTGSETRPVVDLTELRPNVRLGSLSVEVEPDPAPEPAPAALASSNDPLARMIRNAVDRAAEHARAVPAPESESGSGSEHDGDHGGPEASITTDADAADAPDASTPDRTRPAHGADAEVAAEPPAPPTAGLRRAGTPDVGPALGMTPVAPVRVVRPTSRPDLETPAPIAATAPAAGAGRTTDAVGAGSAPVTPARLDATPGPAADDGAGRTSF